MMTQIAEKRSATLTSPLTEFNYESNHTFNIVNALIEIHLPLVTQVTRTIFGSYSLNMDYDDLFNAGVFGLINAIEDYSPDSGIAFHVYCMPFIERAAFECVNFS